VSRSASLLALVVSIGLGPAAAAMGAGPGSTVVQAVVPAGQPIQIAVLSDPGAPLGTSAVNAVQMAVDAHGAVRGHAVQINVVKVTTCGSPLGASTAAVKAANKVVANRQNVAVLGQICSFGFAGALPIYQNARLVTITGSATNNSLTTPARTYLDRTIVNDDLVDDW